MEKEQAAAAASGTSESVEAKEAGKVRDNGGQGREETAGTTREKNGRKTSEDTAGKFGEDREKSPGEAGKFGKFCSAERLFEAYKALQSEFTKRSQRLRELERADRAQAGEANDLMDEEKVCLAAEHPEVKKRVIAAYLRGLNRGGVGTLRSGLGVAALTPAAKPKNLDEAKKLADLILKG